jgi:glycosyltransferase involved in cell wall biosynthesis
MPAAAPEGPDDPNRSADVSVVIAHLNQPQELAILLESLIAGHRRPVEVIVVDNGSTVPPVAICAAFADVRLLHELAPGPGPARNRGASVAQGRILAFTDADCRADADWIASIERAFADPATQIIGGDVRIRPARPSHPSMTEAYEALFSFHARQYIRRHGFALTCNLAMRADVFRAVGGFAGLSVAEDVDWGQRATGLGHVIGYRPDMVIDHPARGSVTELKAKWSRQTAHAFADIGQDAPSRLRWGFRALALGLSPPAALPRILVSRRVRGARARVLAFACLCLVRWHRARVMLWLLSGGDPAALVARWNRPQGRGR